MRKGLNLNFITANISVSETRQAQLNGRDYLAAPVVMAVEGVMNELLYPAEELGKFTEAWNGRPVTLFHPKNKEGIRGAKFKVVTPEDGLEFLEGLQYEFKSPYLRASEVREEK